MGGLRQGSQSFIFEEKPVLTQWASVVGKKESEGPLGSFFDVISKDSYFGQKTWEQAEGHIQETALRKLAEKANISKKDFDIILSGDLLNQCIVSALPVQNSGIPHLGLYGACSTMAESLLLASMVISGGFFNNAVAMTSSHFASSERQYRFPLSYGGQRTPTAQWTVTGAGAVLVQKTGSGPRIESCTVGTVVNMGITDANNMGAAMAPAALATIKTHLSDLNRKPEDYDLIVTGDLGQLGKELLLSLAQTEGISLGGRLTDCGTMIYDPEVQDVHCGGSGCGCSAVTLCGYFLDKINNQSLKRILFCGTGALLSPTSVQQKIPISGICHAVSIEGGK